MQGEHGAIAFHWTGRAACPPSRGAARSAPSSPTPRSSSTTTAVAEGVPAPGGRATTPSSRWCASCPAAASRTSPPCAAGTRCDGDAARRDARRRPGVRGRRPRRLGARARHARRRPRSLRWRTWGSWAASSAGCTPCWGRTSPTPTSRPSDPGDGGPGAAHRDDRRGDRAHVPRPARRQRGGRADRRARRGGARPPAAHVARRRRAASSSATTATCTSARRCARRTRLEWSSTSRASPRGRSSSGGASARRCATSPGCCARSPTRPRRRAILRGAPVPDAWEERARERFLDGYFTEVDAGLLPAERGRHPPAPRDLRAGEGRLRAALRAQQPAGLGADPRVRHRPPAPGAADMTLTDDIVRLRERDLAEPHRILGAHPADGGVVVRAFRPDADAVTREGRGRRGGRPRRASTTPGCSRASWRAASCRCATRWRCATATPRTRVRDPYAFLPSLGELDIHLLGEGRHEELYEKLGAHVRTLDGVPGHGVRGVGARPARSVSVVGDFNSWDGRLHPMRSLGSSGIWELFLPDVGEGAALQVRGPHGRRRAVAQGRPARLRDRAAAAHRLGRPRAAPHVGRRRVAGGPGERRPPAPAGLDLRGARRLLAAEPAGGQPLADLRRACRRAVGLRPRPRLHPRRAAAR